jgi:hypothetical protein
LRLHDRKFHSMLSANQRWLSDRVEGPNIANVVPPLISWTPS